MRGHLAAGCVPLEHVTKVRILPPQPPGYTGYKRTQLVALKNIMHPTVSISPARVTKCGTKALKLRLIFRLKNSYNI